MFRNYTDIVFENLEVHRGKGYIDNFAIASFLVNDAGTHRSVSVRYPIDGCVHLVMSMESVPAEFGNTILPSNRINHIDNIAMSNEIRLILRGLKQIGIRV